MALKSFKFPLCSSGENSLLETLGYLTGVLLPLALHLTAPATFPAPAGSAPQELSHSG